MKTTNHRAWMASAIMAALMGVAPAWAQPAKDPTAADAALLDMREAFRRQDAAALERLLPTVQGHALEPLAAYWALRVRLGSASPEAIRQVLDRHAGTYWEDRLRNDWLLQLGRQRDWATFEAERGRFRMNDDRQVQCYGLMLDAAAGRLPAEEAAAQVRERWLAQREADDGCATAAQSLLDSGHLKPLSVWQRARLAMDSNRLPVVTQAVAMVDPQGVPLIEAIARDPVRYLDEKLTAVRPRTKERVTLAIIRLAANDPAAAAQTLERTRWRAQLTQEEKAWLWGAIGRRAALRQQDEALTYFAQGEDRLMHPEHLAWKARAGLRAQAWGHVRDAIAAMPEAMRQEPTWVYWQARSLLALREPDAARATSQAQALFASIASTRGFYEMLAMEALGQALVSPPAPPPPTTQEREAAERHPGLRRALTALRLGLRTEAVREWHYTVALHTPGGKGDRELLAAADLACRHAVWDRCINTSKRTREVIDGAQRFPMPHRETVLRHTRAIGLDPAYVYGLIRQESRFITDARSHVGASGLMQVMPATARWTARRLGMTDFRPQDITDLDTNVRLGTAYLKMALDDVQGSLPLAAAAYNAGPGRARQWRNGPVLPGEVWAETIPFEETRDYVKRVLANTTNYAALLTGEPQSLLRRLGTVGPRPADAPAENTELP